jgi:hypothetical protein
VKDKKICETDHKVLPAIVRSRHFLCTDCVYFQQWHRCHCCACRRNEKTIISLFSRIGPQMNVSWQPLAMENAAFYIRWPGGASPWTVPPLIPPVLVAHHLRQRSVCGAGGAAAASASYRAMQRLGTDHDGVPLAGPDHDDCRYRFGGGRSESRMDAADNARRAHGNPAATAEPLLFPMARISSSSRVPAGLPAICIQRFCRPTTGSTWWRRFAWASGFIPTGTPICSLGVGNIVRLLGRKSNSRWRRRRQTVSDIALSCPDAAAGQPTAGFYIVLASQGI